MAWTNIPNTDIDQDSPITQTLMTAMRDNIIIANQFIATDDLSNDTVSNFTAFSSGDFDAYYFLLQNVVPANDGISLQLRTSTDGGANYDSGASDYAWAFSRNDASGGSGGVTQSGLYDSSDTRIRLANLVGGAAGESGVSGIVYIYGPHLAAETFVTYQLMYKDNGAGSYASISGGGVRLSAADVNAVQFLFSTGNLESGTISMYGISNTTGP